MLLDPISRNNYKDALRKYGLDDGLSIDPDFETKLAERRAKWDREQR